MNRFVKLSLLSASAALLPNLHGAAASLSASPTNRIAFSESQGEQSANLVISTLELAMMDSTERERLLASLEAQYGKARVWASTKVGATPGVALAFTRDEAKEKYGVRLRARKTTPVVLPELSQAEVSPKRPALTSERASLLGVDRREVLTGYLNQDDYLIAGTGPFIFVNPTTSTETFGPGLVIPMYFGDGVFAAAWNGNGFGIRTSALSMSLAASLTYEGTFWDVLKFGVVYPARRAKGNDLMLGVTRDVQSSQTVPSSIDISAVASFGADSRIGAVGSGLFIMGGEAPFVVSSILGGPLMDVSVTSYNTNKWNSSLSARGALRSNFENLVGNVWVGNSALAGLDNDKDPDSQKSVPGVLQVQVVFVADAGIGLFSRVFDYDWQNDLNNNNMERGCVVGPNSSYASGSRFSGVAKNTVPIAWPGKPTIAAGFQVWTGLNYSGAVTQKSASDYDRYMDGML